VGTQALTLNPEPCARAAGGTGRSWNLNPDPVRVLQVLAEMGPIMSALEAATGRLGGPAARSAAGVGAAPPSWAPSAAQRREEWRAHDVLVAELLGELLTGQVAGPDARPPPHGAPRAGRGSGGAAGGKEAAARPPPRKLPGLLHAAGCWHLGCAPERLGEPAPHACAGCGLARYCGPACQRVHWPLHRAQCLRWRQELGGRAPELVDEPRPA
jgi:hypothetical protein